MRTVGTFSDVYEAAKSYALNHADDGAPMNPVVRREQGRWMLESGLNSTDGDFETTLESFDLWFHESYADDDYSPSEEDVAEFVAANRSEDDE